MHSPRKVLLTTSRNPTPKIRTFCHELSRVLPNTIYVNRGKMSEDEIAEKTIAYDADNVVTVDRWQGGFSVLRFSRISEFGLMETLLAMYVRVKLQREFGASRGEPATSISIAAHGKPDELVRLAHVLSSFFSLPISAVEETHKASRTIISISYDKSTKIAVTFVTEPGHIEVGPRIIVSMLEW